jgi:hypothetical protein
MRVFIPRFLGTIAYLLALTVVGALGYMAIEGWPMRDAVYMTVITLTAVGYQEVQPLSALGRDFTMLLLAAGITGVGVWFALITSFIVEFDLSGVSKKPSALAVDSQELPGGSDRRRGRHVIDQRGEFVFNPAAHTRLDIGDEVIVLPQPDQVARLRTYAEA